MHRLRLVAERPTARTSPGGTMGKNSRRRHVDKQRRAAERRRRDRSAQRTTVDPVDADEASNDRPRSERAEPTDFVSNASRQLEQILGLVLRDRLWASGWQPDELVRHVRRGSDAATTAVLSMAIVADTAHHDRVGDAVHDSWRRQTGRIGAQCAHEPDRDGWMQAVARRWWRRRRPDDGALTARHPPETARSADADRSARLNGRRRCRPGRCRRGSQPESEAGHDPWPPGESRVHRVPSGGRSVHGQSAGDDDRSSPRRGDRSGEFGSAVDRTGSPPSESASTSPTSRRSSRCSTSLRRRMTFAASSTRASTSPRWSDPSDSSHTSSCCSRRC